MSSTHVVARTGKTPYTIELQSRDHHWLADEAAEHGGADTGPSPSELLLSSLAACTAITLQMYAARKAWPLAAVSLDLTLNPDGKPASGTDILRRLRLEGDLDDSQRQRLLQIASACPVHKLLTGEVRIDTLLAEEDS